ncbi:unnamed protein product [Miscanthus lutarioriparius]|uniref:Uncharacterized protein n=1 Tax=Miscanthus lutarioriparius TaxID=422564 RepID=A0A811P0K5_9POAL|nr:unnamed protein product [Miscanthus lutarioriparius]
MADGPSLHQLRALLGDAAKNQVAMNPINTVLAQIPTNFGPELHACLRCRLVKTYDQNYLSDGPQ